MQPTTKPKRIAVVGAGAAGITAALTLSRRGHTVILYERSNQIGGQLNLAKVIPGKEEYHLLLEYWTRELRESNVILKMEAEFTLEDITRCHQTIDRLVMCVGSQPRPISDDIIIGARSRKVVTFEEVLTKKVICGNKVAIIGNGPIAWDVASYLIHDHRICRDPVLFCKEFGIDLVNSTIEDKPLIIRKNNREVYLMQKAHNDPMLPRSKGWHQKLWLRAHNMDVNYAPLFTKIGSEGINLSWGQAQGGNFYYPADSIVWCYGMLPNFATASWLREWVREGSPERGMITDDFSIYFAGSCRDNEQGQGNSEQDLMKWIYEGYELGCKL
jgi:NADH dehydrogenase FAD-containing subunit